MIQVRIKLTARYKTFVIIDKFYRQTIREFDGFGIEAGIITKILIHVVDKLNASGNDWIPESAFELWVFETYCRLSGFIYYRIEPETVR